MRRIGWITGGVAALLVLVLIAAGLWAKFTVDRSFPQTTGEIELSGLRSQVDVRRDQHGVPQIYADNADDLFRAQGYVHAQDRFFEMDFRRHVTSGRLAEWFGRDQLETDKLIRTFGWHHVAQQEFEQLAPETRAALEEYAAGVNDYLDERSGARLSVEYTGGMLGPEERPEPWTVVDSLAWLKAMAWDLNGNLSDEVDRVLASAKSSPERVEELYPDYPADRNPSITDGKVAGGSFQAADTPSGRTSRRAPLPGRVTERLEKVRGLLRGVPRMLGTGDGLGSNSWVVSGQRTESGKPLLANDPHLAASMPSIWTQVGLHCSTVDDDCPFEVAGFSFAGMPGVVIGHNDQIAWGFTNLAADVMDLYAERVDGDTYQVNGQSRPLETRRETIVVKGQEDPVEFDVRSTRNGPLLSDGDATMGEVAEKAPVAEEDAGWDYGVSLRWTALEPGRTADAIFAMNKAQNWKQFRSAAAKFEVPSQNLVYADQQGNIGYQAPGRIPVRNSGDGRWPAPGWTDEGQWTSYIPFGELPSSYNPKRGYVVTANNAVVGPDYPHHLADTWAYGYRARRITDRLESADKVTAQTMRDIQLDSTNGNAAFLVPKLTDVDLDDPFIAEAQDLLKGWDGKQDVDSAPAAYFNAVWKKLLENTFGDELPKSAWPSGGDRWYEVVREMLADPDNAWWDDVDTPQRENAEDMLRAALVDARKDLTRLLAKDPQTWRWGKLHQIELRSQTFGSSGIGPLEWLFNRGPFEVAGGTDAVLANGWNAGTDRRRAYGVGAVPSMRMVVDLADLDGSTWVNLSGVSGHPGHKHYDDQIELWRSGRQAAFPFSADAVRKAAVDTLRLVPGDAG